MADQQQTKPPFVVLLQHTLQQRWRILMDQLVPHIAARWVLLVFLFAIYFYRVYSVQGFYIVTYGLGIFVLNLFIGFLTPLDLDEGDGPVLPTHEADEYKPFVRKLPEYKFWYSCSKAVLISFCMTFFQVFNIPVFWPILLVYFVVLFMLTMKAQIKNMIKHKYLPFSFGKKAYKGKGRSIAEDIRSK